MKVSTYLMFLILGCSICGLVVFLAMSRVHQTEQDQSGRVNAAALTLRDISGLERSFGQWMLLSDLILGADVSYLNHGAIQLGDQFQSLVHSLSNQDLGKFQTQVATIQEFALQHQQRLNEVEKLGHQNRQQTLSKYLEELDVESQATLQQILALRQGIESQHQNDQAELAKQLGFRQIKNTSLILGFLGSVVFLWIWISWMLSHPISQLADRTRSNNDLENRFQVKRSYPTEVQQLASSFSSLVTDMEYQIDEHKKTAKERDKLHRELVDVSRRAGMAEVASEVLHNVGNVLNSINVSANYLQTSQQSSLLPKLAIARNFLLEHAETDDTCLHQDPRGKHFPSVLDHITDELVDDRDNQIRETNRLIQNINHIRAVIRSQLDHSQSCGVIEQFRLIEVLQDSMEINRNKAEQLGATLRLQCPKDLQLTSDRHKLQQVIINLISNALNAIESASFRVGCVEIQVRQVNDGVDIRIIDNGIGILKENMEKIFMQGFTTRKDGHGFGLHSCALTAQILGGQLNVVSGTEQGAEFALSLPINRSELCKI